MDIETLTKANKLQQRVEEYDEDIDCAVRMENILDRGSPMQLRLNGVSLYIHDPGLQHCLVSIAKVALQVYRTNTEKELEEL